MGRPRRARPLEQLIDASPCWVGAGGEGVTRSDTGEPVPRREGVGLHFDCPIHEDCYVCVPVNPALDGGPPDDDDGHGWMRTGGADFATVTLSPSIRILGGPDGCEWHGFIQGGRFKTCGDAR